MDINSTAPRAPAEPPAKPAAPAEQPGVFSRLYNGVSRPVTNLLNPEPRNVGVKLASAAISTYAGNAFKLYGPILVSRALVNGTAYELGGGTAALLAGYAVVGPILGPIAVAAAAGAVGLGVNYGITKLGNFIYDKIYPTQPVQADQIPAPEAAAAATAQA